MSLGILHLSHIALRASDVERSVAFYRDGLGLQEVSRLRYPDGALMLVNLRVNQTQWIEIFNAARLPIHGGPIHQIAWAVADAEAVRVALQECGFPVPEQCPRGQMGNAYLLAQDSNGYELEFVEYLPEGWPLRDPLAYPRPNPLFLGIGPIDVVVRNPAGFGKIYETLLGLEKQDYGSWGLSREQAWIRPVADLGQSPQFCMEVEDFDYLSPGIRNNERADGRLGNDPILLTDPEGVRVILWVKNPSQKDKIPKFERT